MTVITVRNVVAARLCFHRHLWFCSQGRGCGRHYARLTLPNWQTPSRGRHPIRADTSRWQTPPADTRLGKILSMLPYTYLPQSLIPFLFIFRFFFANDRWRSGNPRTELNERIDINAKKLMYMDGETTTAWQNASALTHVFCHNHGLLPFQNTICHVFLQMTGEDLGTHGRINERIDINAKKLMYIEGETTTAWQNASALTNVFFRFHGQ